MLSLFLKKNLPKMLHFSAPSSSLMSVPSPEKKNSPFSCCAKFLFFIGIASTNSSSNFNFQSMLLYYIYIYIYKSCATACITFAAFFQGRWIVLTLESVLVLSADCCMHFNSIKNSNCARNSPAIINCPVDNKFFLFYRIFKS